MPATASILRWKTRDLCKARGVYGSNMVRVLVTSLYSLWLGRMACCLKTQVLDGPNIFVLHLHVNPQARKAQINVHIILAGSGMISTSRCCKLAAQWR